MTHRVATILWSVKDTYREGNFESIDPPSTFWSTLQNLTYRFYQSMDFTILYLVDELSIVSGRGGRGGKRKMHCGFVVLLKRIITKWNVLNSFESIDKDRYSLPRYNATALAPMKINSLLYNISIYRNSIYRHKLRRKTAEPYRGLT